MVHRLDQVCEWTCSESGFTLLELMICLALVAILTLLALPNYHHYLRRAYYVELIQAAMPYKLGVASCFQQMGTLTACSGGEHDVPMDQTLQSEAIASIRTYQGRIQVVPQARHGLNEQDDLLLIPEPRGDQVFWRYGGGGVAHGYVH